MAKKKNGRNPRNALESTDRKLIGDAFDDAIRFARKNSSHPNVPKIYDLVGPIPKLCVLLPDFFTFLCSHVLSHSPNLLFCFH